MTSGDTRRLVLLVLIAACLPYLQTINDYFTQDDFGVIQLLSNRPWTMFPRWFAVPWMEDIWGYKPDEIRPFVALSYQITAIPGGARPELHHVLNIAIHAANAVMVMAIGRSCVGLSAFAAAAAGVIFAVLPVQAESVAWITGRVDSMPAFFYLATFLAYARSRDPSSIDVALGRRHLTLFPAVWYAAALGLFFVALFSKQNTITMVATLVTYDVLILDRQRRGSWWSCVKVWVPFAVMTAGYLLLRRVLFGASVRGGLESPHQLVVGAEMIGRHFLRTALGHLPPLASWEAGAAILIGAVVAVLAFRHARVLRALGFAVTWWIIGAVPVLVAGYESPRHVYLASAAWAFVIGLFLEAAHRALPHSRQPALRAAPFVLATLIVGIYSVRLHQVVNTWGSWSRISQAAVNRVAEEAAAAPEGTLLLVGVPRKSWEWSAPFVLQPPYTSSDLTKRVHLVTPFRLHCCGPDLWAAYTRKKLEAWLEAPNHPPVIALYFAPETGVVSRLTEAERPDLRVLLSTAVTADSWETLDDGIVRMLERLVKR